MRVVHLELPRIFTFTVKEYQVDTANAVKQAGHEFKQYDTNPLFWKWMMSLSTPHSPQDCLQKLLDARQGPEYWPVLSEINTHFIDIASLYGVKFDFYGLHMQRGAMNSSYGMCALVADNYGCGFFANFFHNLNRQLNFLDADIISLGVDYQEGIFWALQLSAWIRASGSKAHINIARHSYENYSLVHHIDALAKNKWFFGQIDSVTLYEEEMPSSVAGLASYLDGGLDSNLNNIAIRLGNDVRVIPVHDSKRNLQRLMPSEYTIPEEYFDAMEIPREHIVYQMQMVRNKCFYKKCTFCVQISKHLSDVAYDHAAEIARSLEAFAELDRHNVRMVNMLDEAMRPVDAKKFSQSILDKKIDVKWVGRTITGANPNSETLKLMYEAGCREILFGLETFDPELAKQMGKISGTHADHEQTAKVVDTYLDAGLFVTLSMIYNFPTETAKSLDLTLKECEAIQAKSDKVAYIFNRFGLYHTSAVYQNPEQFNIAELEPTNQLNDLQYHFLFRVASNADYLTQDHQRRMHQLEVGLNDQTYALLSPKLGSLLNMLYTLDYNSFGLHHRAQADKTLLQHVYETSMPAGVG